VALKIVDHQDIIKVKPMEKPEAIELLRRKVGLPAETPDILKLVEELDFMPLAIIQAAGYIAHRAPRCSVSQYLEMFQKSDREATKLLDYEAGHPYRDWEAKNSILVTWKISFEHIRSIRPSATDLLSLMSFFDRQGVSENLLRVYDKIQNNTSSSEETTFGYNDNDTDHNFEDDITTLRDFSFISINRDSTVFMMHRLVQLSVHVWLKANRQLERWKEQFIMALWQRFPTGKYENWAQCQSLFPHVKSAMSQKPESHDFLEKWATLLYNGAWYAREIGNIRESRDMASESRNQRLLIFGFDSEKTLGSSAMLGEAYRLEGQWGDAEQLEVQVMETSKTKLGADHPNTLTSMANLASTYRNQGRWEEAEQLVVQVMETRKTKFGADHPDTLTSMNNLASTYRNQGRWEEAEQLEVQVIETSKTMLEADHPNMLTSMANLALTFWNQGRWEEAEQLEVQVMETRKTKFGADHPDTLTSMNNLAHTLRSSGQYTAALRLMADCVQLLDRKLGPDHPHTISSKSALNEWRGKVDSLSSQLTKPPTDTKEASILRNSTETSEQVSRPGGRRKRTTIFRLFGRK
jgi:tetratricopeptide (TPR) repeat protein